MAPADKNLTCRDCGKTFVFTVGEQEFYRSRGLQHEPSRCPECRTTKRKYGSSGPRVMHKAICADCGKECEVPFEPREGRPVYCGECYPKTREQQA
ncbi:MAG TPA: zinc-ribbon domain containing protein [Dehalococcoidia bacterium]|nr:zinc-ribbon domain containing protein [Dehalococcoidia bacterium]